MRQPVSLLLTIEASDRQQQSVLRLIEFASVEIVFGSKLLDALPIPAITPLWA